MSKNRRAVVALIRYEDEILLGKKVEGDGLLSGKWHILGETLREGERDEDGIVRCGREEVGLDIEILRHLDFHKSPGNTSVNWYECVAYSRDFKAGSDLSEAKWVSREDVPRLCHRDGRDLWPEKVWEYFGLSGYGGGAI